MKHFLWEVRKKQAVWTQVKKKNKNNLHTIYNSILKKITLVLEKMKLKIKEWNIKDSN